MTSPIFPTKKAVQQLADKINTILQQAGIPRVRWSLKGELEQAGYQISSSHWDYVGLWYCTEPHDRELYKTEVRRIKDTLDKHFSRPHIRLDGYRYQLNLVVHDSEYVLPSVSVFIRPNPGILDKIRHMFRLDRQPRR